MERSNAPPAKAARRAEEARRRASDEPAALSNVPPAEAAGPTARAPEPAAADSLHLAEREHPTNFQELPAEARPQSMAGGKHSFTLKKDGSQSRVSVLLRSRAFYVKPALEIAANHGLEIDKRQGSHISWTLYGGAVGAFEVAKQVAGWAPRSGTAHTQGTAIADCNGDDRCLSPEKKQASSLHETTQLLLMA